jgi:hypothetical protein
MSYIFRVLVALDILANVLIGGKVGETLSGSAYRGELAGRILPRIVPARDRLPRLALGERPLFQRVSERRNQEVTMTDINLQEYGRLEQQVEQLTKDVEEMQADIKVIKALLEQASGGWKTLVWVGGAAAAGATALQWVASHVSLK